MYVLNNQPITYNISWINNVWCCMTYICFAKRPELDVQKIWPKIFPIWIELWSNKADKESYGINTFYLCLLILIVKLFFHFDLWKWTETNTMVTFHPHQFFCFLLQCYGIYFAPIKIYCIFMVVFKEPFLGKIALILSA